MPQSPTRKASAAHGAALAFLRPRLAHDAKVDIARLFANVTDRNYVASLPGICTAIATATNGKLTTDAKVGDLMSTLMAIDEIEPEEEHDDPAPQAAMPEQSMRWLAHMARKLDADAWGRLQKVFASHGAAEDDADDSHAEVDRETDVDPVTGAPNGSTMTDETRDAMPRYGKSGLPKNNLDRAMDARPETLIENEFGKPISGLAPSLSPNISNNHARAIQIAPGLARIN